jgi:tRNA dimethylallyltransferase
LIAGAEADPELRAALEKEHEEAVRADDPERLHRRLAASDPQTAARIHPKDTRRVVRALEIQAGIGAPASEVREAHDFADRPYRVLHLALDVDRSELNARIDARCAAMVESGLLRETRALLDRGYGFELRPMQAIGYRHMRPVVQGADTLVNALAAMQHDTRQFARRQRTWLRAVSDAVWLDPGGLDEIFATVETFLAAAPGRCDTG